MSGIDLDELQGSVDWVSVTFVENEAFICRKTGIIYWFSGDGGLEDEEVELPPDIEDLKKYVPVPTKYDLNIGNRLAYDFAAKFLVDQYDDVRDMFRRKGAYGRFKEMLAERDLLESWYAYSGEQTLQALREWCESEGLAIEN
jgi:hypothetical protein